MLLQDGADEFPKNDADLERQVSALWEDPGRRNGWFGQLDDCEAVKRLMNLVLKVNSLKAAGGGEAGGDNGDTAVVDSCVEVMDTALPDVSLSNL
jgi:hypothetical protein